MESILYDYGDRSIKVNSQINSNKNYWTSAYTYRAESNL